MTTLDLNGVSTDVPGAWHIDRSLVRLLGAPAKRGENTAAPYALGRIAHPQWPDQLVVDLSMNVFGLRDSAGAPHSDPSAGLIANLLYLRDNIFAADTTVTATIPAVLHLPGGDRVADVQVANDLAVDRGGVVTITFDLIVPAGGFEVPPP